MHFELESESRRARDGGEGISTAFANMELRTADSSPANEVAERDLAIARGGMISDSVSNSSVFSVEGADDGLPPNLKSLLSRPSDGRDFMDFMDLAFLKI
jgi:hypothetical protein